MPASPVDDPPRPVPPAGQPRWLKLYEHADHIVNRIERIWKIFRPVFVNRITLIAVVGGLGIASGPLWVDIVVISLHEYFPGSAYVKEISKSLQSYKSAVDNVDVAFGVLLVISTLIYHFVAHQFEKFRVWNIYLHEFDHLKESEKADQKIITDFDNLYPTVDMPNLFSDVITNGSDAAIQQLLARFNFWRDDKIRFRDSDLETARKTLMKSYVNLATYLREHRDGQPASESDKRARIDDLAVSYRSVLDVPGAYRKRLNLIKSERGVS